MEIRIDAADVLISLWTEALSYISSEKEVVFSIIDTYVLMHSVDNTRSFCQTLESVMHIYLFGYRAGRIWKYKRETGVVSFVTQECGFLGDYLKRLDQLAISLKRGVPTHPSDNEYHSVRLWHDLDSSMATFSGENHHQVRLWYIENANSWFRYIAGELVNPGLGLFQKNADGLYTVGYGLTPLLYTDDVYRFTGQFLAKALLEKETLPIRLERAFYEQIIRGVDAYTTVDVGSIFRVKMNNPILEGFYDLIPHAELRKTYLSPAELALALEE